MIRKTCIETYIYYLFIYDIEQREELRGRYNVTLCSYCLMAGEQREEWRGRYNVTLCSYCLMALRVAMIHGELTALYWAWVLDGRIGMQQLCDIGNITVREKKTRSK